VTTPIIAALRATTKEPGRGPPRPYTVEGNLRYVLLQLIKETAGHAGHADIIRETIDGIRGL
jgi:hypothetical protein